MIDQNTLFRIANALRNELFFAFPVKGTDLKNSINVEPTERGLMISMLEYGKYVEFGSNPHVIRAKNKKVLAVPIKDWAGDSPNRYGSGKLPMLSKDGRFVLLGKKVRHPGVRPTYFVRNTVMNKLPGIIQKELSR